MFTGPENPWHVGWGVKNTCFEGAGMSRGRFGASIGGVGIFREDCLALHYHQKPA